jgi:hypothetical protein
MSDSKYWFPTHRQVGTRFKYNETLWPSKQRKKLIKITRTLSTVLRELDSCTFDSTKYKAGINILIRAPTGRNFPAHPQAKNLCFSVAHYALFLWGQANDEPRHKYKNKEKNWIRLPIFSKSLAFFTLPIEEYVAYAFYSANCAVSQRVSEDLETAYVAV